MIFFFSKRSSNKNQSNYWKQYIFTEQLDIVTLRRRWEYTGMNTGACCRFYIPVTYSIVLGLSLRIDLVFFI